MRTARLCDERSRRAIGSARVQRSRGANAPLGPESRSAGHCCFPTREVRAWPRTRTPLEPGRRTALRPAGSCWSAACRSAAPTRSSSSLPRSSANGSIACRTVRPARDPTGSCGSTRCSAHAPSSRSARLARLAPRTSPPADQRRRVDRHAAVRAARLRAGRHDVVSHLRSAQARRTDPDALPVPGVAADATRTDRRVRRTRRPSSNRAALRGARC